MNACAVELLIGTFELPQVTIINEGIKNIRKFSAFTNFL